MTPTEPSNADAASFRITPVSVTPAAVATATPPTAPTTKTIAPAAAPIAIASTTALTFPNCSELKSSAEPPPSTNAITRSNPSRMSAVNSVIPSLSRSSAILLSSSSTSRMFETIPRPFVPLVASTYRAVHIHDLWNVPVRLTHSFVHCRMISIVYDLKGTADFQLVKNYTSALPEEINTTLWKLERTVICHNASTKTHRHVAWSR